MFASLSGQLRTIITASLIIGLTAGCGRQTTLQEVSPGVSFPGNVPMSPGGTIFPPSVGIGNGSGVQLPAPDRSNPIPPGSSTDPFREDFLNGQNPWDLLDRQLPPYQPSQNVTESRSVLPAGRYRLVPAQISTASYYAVDIVPPVTFPGVSAECPSGLQGPASSGVSVCLDFAASQSTTPVPVRFRLQTQTGIRTHILWVLILPGNPQGSLTVISNIPSIQVSEKFGLNGIRKEFRVVPSTFFVTLNGGSPGALNDLILTSNDPQVQIVPEGNQFAITTARRGELIVTARSRTTNREVAVLKALVPLQYTVVATERNGTSLESLQYFRVSCNYNGTPNQLMIQSSDGGNFLLPLQPGTSVSPKILRDSSDKMVRATLVIPGNAGPLSCRGEVTEYNSNSTNIDFNLAFQ